MMLKAPRCLTVKPGQSIRLQTEAGGEIVLNVISAADDSLRVEVFPDHVEAVEIKAATRVAIDQRERVAPSQQKRKGRTVPKVAERSRTKKPARGDQPQRLTESPADSGLPVQSESLPGQQSLPMDLPTFTSAGKIIPRPGLVDWLKTLDFEAFLDDWTIPQMRKRIASKYGKDKRTRVGPKEFAEARRLAFDWWKAKTMRPERTDPQLSEDQWIEVKRVVTHFLETMQGLTLRQCVRLTRTEVPCNSTILEGLPQRFHVWKRAR